MSLTERFYVTMPEEIPMFTEGFRVAPNEGTFPVDATVYVQAADKNDDEYLLTFGIERKGPYESDYLITLREADPPLSQQPLGEREVFVRGDKIIHGREFLLDAAMPTLSQTAFKALRIFSNIEQIVIPRIED